MNEYVPLIMGDPNNITTLGAYTRRLLVCRMAATFTAHPDAVDFEQRTFPEDADLHPFLPGGEARAGSSQKAPALERVRKSSTNPSERIMEDTATFVVKTAAPSTGVVWYSTMPRATKPEAEMGGTGSDPANEAVEKLHAFVPEFTIYILCRPP